MTQRNIFFDFDGTLIDSRYRQHRLFCDLVPECDLNFEQYWEIKRARISQSAMVKKYFSYDEEQCKTLHKNWMSEIEAPKRLEEDQGFDGADELLRYCAKNNLIHLVTARQNKELVIKQLDHLGWTDLFTTLLVTEQTFSKEELIRSNVSFTDQDFMVGDTGEDIKTAKNLGLKSIGVTYGILNSAVISEYTPTYTAHTTLEIKNILE